MDPIREEMAALAGLLAIARTELKEHEGEYKYSTSNRLIELLDAVVAGDCTAVGAIRSIEMDPTITNGRYV